MLLVRLFGPVGGISEALAVPSCRSLRSDLSAYRWDGGRFINRFVNRRAARSRRTSGTVPAAGIRLCPVFIATISGPSSRVLESLRRSAVNQIQQTNRFEGRSELRLANAEPVRSHVIGRDEPVHRSAGRKLTERERERKLFQFRSFLEMQT